MVDHGGILADQRDPAEQVADALARQPDPTLAARNDPWVLDRQLRERIAEHEHVLAGAPPDVEEQLAAGRAELEAAQQHLAAVEAEVAESVAALEGRGALAGLSRSGREEQRLEERLGLDRQRAAAARDEHDAIAARVGLLQAAQDARQRFQQAEGWRRDDIDRVRCEIDRHWAAVVVACVAADDPLAYGIDKLRHARPTLDAERQAIDAGIPDDRTQEWEETRVRLPDLIRRRHQADQAVADSRARSDDAGKRRWGRQDQDAIAEAAARLAEAQQRAEEVGAAERELRERLAGLAEHQRARQEHIAGVAGRRTQTDQAVAQLDDALDRTRPDRVARLVDDPPEHLVTRLGPPPGSPAGRAVWCHHALELEADLDRHDGQTAGLRQRHVDRARHEIAVADRLLQVGDDQPDVDGWAELAAKASTTLDQLRHAQRQRLAVQRLRAQRRLQPSTWTDQALPAQPYSPEL